MPSQVPDDILMGLVLKIKKSFATFTHTDINPEFLGSPLKKKKINFNTSNEILQNINNIVW